MIINKLLSDLVVHAGKWVELAFEVIRESIAGLNDLSHDFLSLIVCDARSKGEISQVATHTNTGALDHLGFILRELWAIEAVAVHFRDVLVRDLVAVVGLNQWVKELAELRVRAVRAGVKTNAGVNVLAATKNTGLE